jgi:Domain of unknown function (DUF4352)
MKIVTRQVAAIGAALAALTLVSACSLGSTSAGSSSAGGANADTKAGGKDAQGVTTVKIGQPITITRNGVVGAKAVAEVTVSDLKAGAKGADEFAAPQHGQFITVKVNVVGKEGKYTIDPYDFKIVGADGTVFNPTPAAAMKPELQASEVGGGQKVSGYIAFDAAVGAEKGGKISLKDLYIGADAGYWTL